MVLRSRKNRELTLSPGLDTRRGVTGRWRRGWTTSLLLASLGLGGCAVATESTVPARHGVGGPAPTRPDRSAGLVGIASGFDLRAYEVIAVDRFEVADPAVQSESDRVRAGRLATLLHGELIRQIVTTRLFADVINLAEVVPTWERRRILRLEGTMTRLDSGSPALRYFVGLGTGRSTAEVLMRFVDAGSRDVVMVTFDRRVSPFDVLAGNDRDLLTDSLADMARDLAEFLTRLARGEAPQAND